jgi:PAP2 superfamily
MLLTRLGIVLWVALVASIVIAAPARADTVTEWHAHAVTALGATAGQTPPVSVLHLAMVHGAVYDAVNAIDRRYEPYLVAPRARRWYSKDAAAATAAYRVLAGLLPAQQRDLEALYAASLASVPPGRAKDRGVVVGVVAAAAMLAVRANDGRFGAFRFPVGTEPGEWRPTPPMFINDPNAWLGQVRPFLIESASQFNSRGPNPLASAKYAEEFNEVKAIGSLASSVRTADQTDAARFWAGGFAPWVTVTSQLSIDHKLSIDDNARLFAMLYLTAADAGIACWDDKARWLFWRPVTAVAEAGMDGNPATTPAAGWMPLINTPPYPDHPSGLLCFAGSFARTLVHFFGTDRITFSVTSANSGTTRRYTSFSQALQEALNARVWSGIHFRTADEQGARIGKQVARYSRLHYFHPLSHRRNCHHPHRKLHHE